MMIEKNGKKRKIDILPLTISYSILYINTYVQEDFLIFKRSLKYLKNITIHC